MEQLFSRRPQICCTKTLPRPNQYTLALDGELSHLAFSEERAPLNKGKWREKVFAKDQMVPLDLEIGTGNGFHFAHHTSKFPERLLVGMELKYKPLIQSLRRSLRNQSRNGAMVRYHAFNIEDLFAPEEINDVFIHFPDPWTTPKRPGNRVVNRVMLQRLYSLQRPGSFLEFKTDSREYFLWALPEIAASPYKVEVQTLNLYSDSDLREGNFATAFEKIFVSKGVEINYIKLRKS